MPRFRPTFDRLQSRLMPSDFGTIGLPMVDPPDLSRDATPVQTMEDVQKIHSPLDQIDWTVFDWSAPTVVVPPLDPDGVPPVPLDADDPSVIRIEAETVTKSTTLSPE